ncbi:hypothetical protein PLIIFM63780_007463 [Purpureocillium lilacinum]|nr:hypothetical protein PLIIFM63780_007463 [Purpureocillium lilacinum]
MSPRHSKDSATGSEQRIPSKDMPPLPTNFLPVFFRNQFRTTIELPTAEAYPDVHGKCALVTGANTGLGFESAAQLLSLGLSRLVMAVRSLEKGEVAASKLRAANPSATIDVWQLDMESYESIQSFVHKCESLPRIDVAILNAGISPMHFATVPATGHERTMQVNHMSTVLLALLLLPVLKGKSSGAPPRLTVVNSVMAHLCSFPNRDERPLLASFDDTSVTPLNSSERYGVSKLLCQLALVRLADMVDPEAITINMVDPGLTKGTGLSRDATGIVRLLAGAFLSICGRPVARGAATYVDAALRHGTESHGCFLMNCEVAGLARWYYNGGKELSEQVWTETMDELRFAGVEQAIASVQRLK